MIKRKEHSCCYEVHRAIVHKLTGTQLFWLCMIALVVLGVIGIFAPKMLFGVF